MDKEDIQFINTADKFLQNIGLITNYQKNNLILVPLMIDRSIKNVEVQLDTIKQEISVILCVKFFSLVHFKKNKILRRATDFYKEYLANYKIISIKLKYV